MQFVLHQIMKTRGITYAQISKDTGISTHTLINLVKGKKSVGDTDRHLPANIGLEAVLGRLCDYLHCTPNDLIKPGEGGMYGA